MRPSEHSQGFWDLLPHEDRRALWSLGRDREYPPGATLCIEGDPATHVFILLDGWRKRGLIRTGQRRITLTDVPGLRKAAGPARAAQS